MEVGHDKVRVVQLDVYRRIAQEDAGDPTGEEEGNQADRKKHRRRKPDVTFPQGCYIVKDLNRRWNSDDQGQ